VTTNAEFEGRIALVTGATRGIGRAIARALARDGVHVIALGRVKGALEELYDDIKHEGGTATLVELDLTNGDDIDALGPSLLRRWDKLDIFIGNAGILGPLSPLTHIPPDDWQRVIDINLTANWRLLRTLDPLLKRSDAGRVILVSSGASSGKYAYWGPYAVSKAGTEALAMTYAQEVENSSVRINLINPGPIATRMRAKAFPGEDQKTLHTPDDIAPMFVEFTRPSCTKNGELLDGRAWLTQNAPSKVAST